MIATTTETVIDHDIEKALGTVRGNTIHARNVGRDITQELRNIVGDKLKSHTRSMVETCDETTDRVVAEAEAMGANAIVGVRHVTIEVAQGTAEILVYGTAATLVDGTDPDTDAGSASESNTGVA